MSAHVIARWPRDAMRAGREIPCALPRMVADCWAPPRALVAQHGGRRWLRNARKLHDVGRNVRRAWRGGVRQAAARYALPAAAVILHVSRQRCGG
ncbi:hypothetical protein F511_46225 [Dorcoceras hygrometricum]|uniref:Uncharacterized protein n=1 Tax=Dorcoceras hygrometricum TaxID=472368 RepID=A0A2Z6ZV65_9LAMI|nr:hypothetical protein F511_46225 [Dorcoceras hygrometricum]